MKFSNRNISQNIIFAKRVTFRRTHYFLFLFLFLECIPHAYAFEPIVASSEVIIVFKQQFSNRNKTNIYVTGHPDFSAEFFWERILGLINKNNGYVNKEEIEKSFNIKFSNPPMSDGQFDNYSEAPGNSRGIDLFLSLSHDKKQSYVDFEWTPDTFINQNKESCVSIEKARADLESEGWGLVFRSVHPIIFDNYKKNKSNITLYYSSCIYGVRFSGKDQ